MNLLSSQGYWEQKIAPELRRLDLRAASNYHRVIVELSGNDIREIQAIVDANQGKLHKKTNIIPSLVAEVPFSAIEALAKSKQVKRIWRDNPIKII